MTHATTPPAAQGLKSPLQLTFTAFFAFLVGVLWAPSTSAHTLQRFGAETRLGSRVRTAPDSPKA
jgi:hypothetical protein